MTICESSLSSQDVYTTNGRGVKVQILTDSNSNFLLEYEGKQIILIPKKEHTWIFNCRYEIVGSIIRCQ